MIWIENVRPIKEYRRHINIHVQNRQKAEELMKLLAEFNPGYWADYRGTKILDYVNRVVISYILATDTEWEPWIKRLGLVEYSRRYNTRHYVLREEIS